MAKTLAIKLPGNLSLIIFSFLALIVLISASKFIVAIIKIVTFKNSLHENKSVIKKLDRLLAKTNLQSKVVVISSFKPLAFCFGIVTPKVYISTKMIKILSEQELETVLRHEKYHLENRDTLILLLANIFESLLPFFPLIADIIRQYRIERELLADGAASIGLNGERHLSVALSKLLKHDLKYNYAFLPAIADMDTLELRIRRLKHIPTKNNKFRVKNVLVSFMSGAFLFLLAIMPVSAVELHTESDDAMVICNQSHTCIATCQDFKSAVLQSSAIPFSPAASNQ